jgi:uncharacterized glyoxalase superfamily protein PhnB
MATTGEPQNIFPVLRYSDAPAAIEWLVRVLRFEAHEVIDNPDGTIAHAELKLGSSMIMLGSDRPPQQGVPAQPPGRGWVYITLDDVDAHHDHAKNEGAEIAMELTNTDYGSRDFAVRDPEGNLWAFGTYSPYKEG